jgi:hypothetical protein
MANIRGSASENLHSISRHLIAKYDRPLSISDTIIFLTLYYSKQSQLGLELNTGIWNVSEINGEEPSTS